MNLRQKLCVYAFVILYFTVETVLAHYMVNFRNYTETLYFVSQIINCMIVALGVIFAGWQFFLSKRDSARNMDIIRVQKAIDLSQFYKDNILGKYPPVRYIF